MAIQNENQTLASITFQNYFRMYGKLAGMTGTADTEAYEFQQIYGLETVVIPTHMPMVRKDRHDQVYRTAQGEVRGDHQGHQGLPRSAASRCWSARRRSRTPSCSPACSTKEKLAAPGAERQAARARGRDRRAGRAAEDDHHRHQHGGPRHRHRARRQRREAVRFRRGGRERSRAEEKKRRVETLRGEWQALHDQVVKAGGLHIIGTERHESRRIDNQLRGRSGRQGDPGSSRFYMSLEDPLLRIFAGERINRIMVMLKMPEGEAIEHAWSRARSRTRSARSRRATSTSASSCSSTTTSPTTSARTIYALRNELLESQDVSRDASPTCAPACSRDLFRSYVPRGERRGAVGRRRPGARAQGRVQPRAAGRAVAGGARPSSATRRSLERIVEKAQAAYDAKVPAGRRAVVPPVRALRRCCRSSTRTGASTSRRSTTCARASTCAATRRRIRSRNTSARRSSCSAR